MPHVIAAAALATGFYFGYRLAGQIARARRGPRRSEAAAPQREPRDMGPLIFDPETGAYRSKSAGC